MERLESGKLAVEDGIPARPADIQAVVRRGEAAKEIRPHNAPNCKLVNDKKEMPDNPTGKIYH